MLECELRDASRCFGRDASAPRMTAQYVAKHNAVRAKRQICHTEESTRGPLFDHECEHAFATLPSRAPSGNEFSRDIDACMRPKAHPANSIRIRCVAFIDLLCV